MKKTDEFIINRIKWKSAKLGLPTQFSRYFDELSLELKNEITAQLNQEYCGTPVVLFTTQSSEWTLICSKQVVWSDGTSRFSLDLGDIKQIRPAEFDTTLIGQPFDMKKVKKKSEWCSIKVLDKQDNINILFADKGSDLFSLWNTLLMLQQIVA